MRALLYEQFTEPIAVRNVPDPSPPPDGVVLRMKASGIWTLVYLAGQLASTLRLRTLGYSWYSHLPQIYIGASTPQA
jgi:hypothetical protein